MLVFAFPVASEGLEFLEGRGRMGGSKKGRNHKRRKDKQEQNKSVTAHRSAPERKLMQKTAGARASSPRMLCLTKRPGERIAAGEECGVWLGIARRAGSDFDDGIRQLAHRAHECLDDGAVELRVRAAFQFGESLRGWPALFVSPVAGDRVVRVGHRDYPRAQRDVLRRQTVGITGAVEKFVMVKDHFADSRERRERVQNF